MKALPSRRSDLPIMAPIITFERIHGFGLAVSTSGRAYVSESVNQPVREIAPDGSVTTVLSSSGKGSVHYDPKVLGATEQRHSHSHINAIWHSSVTRAADSDDQRCGYGSANAP